MDNGISDQQMPLNVDSSFEVDGYQLGEGIVGQNDASADFLIDHQSHVVSEAELTFSKNKKIDRLPSEPDQVEQTNFNNSSIDQ